MNWNNIDLNNRCERDCELIDGLTFNAFMLEIECKLPEITAATITEQFEYDLQSRVQEAREIFAANLANIIKKAKQERKG